MNLFFECHGDPLNPPVVVLHGLFGSVSNWRSFNRILAENYYVACPDLRNHGQSGWRSDMNYDLLAEDVVSFIKKHHFHHPFLMGHSMGGKTAMTILQNQLIAVRRTIIVDIAPVAYDHDHQGLIDSMLAVDFTQVKKRQDIDQILSDTIKEPATRGFLLQNVVRSGHGYQWRINLNSISSNLRFLVDYKNNNISKSEILFVSGSYSRFISSHGKQAIGNLFPHAQMKTIDGAGHWLHAEKPQQLLELVRAFFI